MLTEYLVVVHRIDKIIDSDSVDDAKKKEVMLIQRLLVKATQPSPVKAMYQAEELEHAALAMCQYLASAAAAKRANLGSPLTATATAADGNKHEEQVEAEASNAEQTAQVPAVTSKDLKTSRRTRVRGAAAAARQPSPPPTATVQSLIDMGFNRLAAEYAIKALGGIGEMTPSPESIVGWLLENQDQIVELKPLMQALPELPKEEEEFSDSESISGSFEDIDASAASEGKIFYAKKHFSFI